MSTSFAQYVARPENEIVLAEAALLIAQDAYPALDVAHYLRWLDAQGELARERIGWRPALSKQIEGLNRLLFDELGFHGNAEQYDDPCNSYLNDVIERRSGIPITLSLIYIEVGTRAGLNIEGVGLPGHFIVRVNAAIEHILLDPFNRGARLTLADCEALMSRVYGRPMTALPQYLEAVDKPTFLTRMLNNLENIHIQNEQWSRALTAIENKLALRAPASAVSDELRALGLVYFKLERLRDAENAWLRYLALQPAALDAPLIRQNIELMRAALAKRN